MASTGARLSTAAEQRKRQRRRDHPTGSQARQQQAPTLRDPPHVHRGDGVGRERDRFTFPRVSDPALRLDRRHRHEEPPVARPQVATSHHEDARSEIPRQLVGAGIVERHGDIRPRLGARRRERIVVVASCRETKGSSQQRIAHGPDTHDGETSLSYPARSGPLRRHRGAGPVPMPPGVVPPTPGPNAAYAAKNPASEAPASNTVLPVADFRSSSERTNSPGTVTVSPFHSSTSPRRPSTARTDSTSPRSVPLRNRPRTIRTLGPM